MKGFLGRKGFIALAIGGVLFFSSCATTGFKAHYNQGQKLLAKEEFEAAEGEFREAVGLRPGDAWAHYYLGEAISERGGSERDGRADQEYEKAEQAFRGILSRNPQDAEARFGLGLALGVQDKFGEAEKEFREVARLRPKDAVVYYNLGNALLSQRKHGEAKSAFEEAVRLRPEEAAARSGLAYALIQEGNYEAAEKELHEIVRLIPNDAKVHLELRGMYLAQERYPEADREQHEFYVVSKRNAEGLARRGRELLMKGKLAEARRQYGKAVQAFPQYAQGHYGLAACLARSGQREEALKSLRNAVDFNFDDWPLIEKDPDLASLRADPQFKDLAETVKKRWEEKQKGMEK